MLVSLSFHWRRREIKINCNNNNTTKTTSNAEKNQIKKKQKKKCILHATQGHFPFSLIVFVHIDFPVKHRTEQCSYEYWIRVHRNNVYEKGIWFENRMTRTQDTHSKQRKRHGATERYRRLASDLHTAVTSRHSENKQTTTTTILVEKNVWATVKKLQKKMNPLSGAKHTFSDLWKKKKRDTKLVWLNRRKHESLFVHSQYYWRDQERVAQPW